MTDHAAEARRIMTAKVAVPQSQLGTFALALAQVYADHPDYDPTWKDPA